MGNNYSKEFRYRIYVEALQTLKKEVEVGLNLYWVCPNLPSNCIDFPEFYKFKPENYPFPLWRGWWPDDDFKSREKALLQCIEETNT